MKENLESSKRVTIKEVAKHAGVTPAVVSRVINHDETLNIKDETRKSVINAVNDLNYIPNLRARSLKTQRNYIIGVVIADIIDPFFSSVVKGIQTVANEAGYTILLFDTGDDLEKGKNVINIARAHCVDGLIIGSVFVDEETISTLDQIDMKYVMVNRSSLSSAPCVISDGQKGTRMITDHLVDLGHRKIAYLSGPPFADISRQRLEGYKQSLLNHHLEYDPEYIMETNFDIDTGRTCCRALLNKFSGSEMPTAICCGNDSTAIGAMEVLSEAGLSIPDDMTVTGYNDIWISDRLTPPLTTVHTPQAEMGSQSFDMLIDMIEGEDTYDENSRITLEPRLVIRESSGAPRTL